MSLNCARPLDSPLPRQRVGWWGERPPRGRPAPPASSAAPPLSDSAGGEGRLPCVLPGACAACWLTPAPLRAVTGSLWESAEPALSPVLSPFPPEGELLKSTPAADTWSPEPRTRREPQRRTREGRTLQVSATEGQACVGRRAKMTAPPVGSARGLLVTLLGGQGRCVRALACRGGPRLALAVGRPRSGCCWALLHA